MFRVVGPDALESAAFPGSGSTLIIELSWGCVFSLVAIY